jgi:hypothetical protein
LDSDLDDNEEETKEPAHLSSRSMLENWKVPYKAVALQGL